MNPTNQQFRIEARPVDLSPDERAARLAQAYDPLLAEAARRERQQQAAETAVKPAETAVRGEAQDDQ